MKRLILILFFIGLTSCSAQDSGLKIHFLDVGYGDAILIQTRQHENVLIDTGNVLSGYKLVEYLKKNNVSVINHLIITHAHLDHILGVFFILPKFKIENLYDNADELDTFGNSILFHYEKIFRMKENYQPLRENNVLKLGDLMLKVIWPPNEPLLGSSNYNSLVILLSYKNFNCLLTADMDSSTESKLLKRGVDLHADVLKVAHHGTDDASSEEFIKKVGPKIAIISVGESKSRRAPARRVLNLLESKGIQIYRTDKNGSIVITLDDKGRYRVATEK